MTAFDGSCKYSDTFSVGTLPAFDFTLTPAPSQTICSNIPVFANIVFSSSTLSSQYSYSWTPLTFIFGGNTTLQQTIISPSVAPGIVNTLVYTVIVTPTAINCPQTKNFSLTIANLLPPSINVVPQLCTYSSPYPISTNPAGGIFSNNTAVSASGLINPTIASAGANSFTYAVNVGTCVAKTTGSFNVGTPPILTVSGNSSFCQGQSSTLLAGGANTYSWSTSASGPFITVSPLVNTTYSVAGFSAITSCSNTTNITVTVMPTPNILILGDSLICFGESTTLTASGANSYAWNNGSLGNVITVSPVFTSTYSVQGSNALGTCFGSQMVTVKVIDCTVNEIGLNEWFAEGGLNIYPNPSSGKITIESRFDLTISLHNALGKTLLNEHIQKGNHQLDLSNYADGIYFLNITRQGEVKVMKLVKKD